MPQNLSERNGPLHTAGSQGVSGRGHQLPPLRGLASQISWANQIRAQVNVSFDRIASAIRGGSQRYKSLEPSETAVLLHAVEEHRAKVFEMVDAQYFVDQWQDPTDSAQRLIHGDERWKSILEARAVRNPRPEPVVPVRYIGFDDAKGIRIFKFGTLPANNATPVYTVQVPVELFQKHGISLQDGPAMCSALIASREPADHLFTDDDCRAFIALRPVKEERKAPRRKQADSPEAEAH